MKNAFSSMWRVGGVFLLILFLFPSLDVFSEDKPEERIRELEKKIQLLTEEIQKMKSEKPTEKEDRIEEIERRLEILAEEIQDIKSAAVVEEPTYERAFGLGPAASKVYRINRGLSIAGYGELAVSQFREDEDNIIDAQRLILYAGYKFNDRIIFNSEIEFEHGTTEENLDEREGSVSVEFASLDFLINDYFNLRGGLLLVPFGIINEVHEPTTFFGVLRPDVERFVIPTTWRESGAGIFGEVSDIIPGTLSYRAYVINSLDSRGFSASGNRDARPSGNRARFNDFAFVSRLEYDPFPGIKFGGSWFIGQTGQNERVNGEKIDGLFQMYEADMQLLWKGLEARALFVYSFLDDADLININNGLEGDESVGDEQFGWYVEAGYNLFSLVDWGEYLQYFAPFIRFEKFDTQKSVPAGFTRNPANDRQTLTLGFSYKPIPQVVIKADYQRRDNEADISSDQFNLGLGFVF
ncbi:MAG: hypothetical protein KatS3mg078_1202 [Deltaproteobacteria bacterium]|jgi:hypothetical protein|nr:MAG: hypothetical protein KatS3mg078_1202 [Deltaproteobacteria bacterium]